MTSAHGLKYYVVAINVKAELGLDPVPGKKAKLSLRSRGRAAAGN